MNRITTDIHTAYRTVRGERYIVLFTDETRAEALRQLGRWASNPELNFGWYEAAALSQEIQAVIGAEK